MKDITTNQFLKTVLMEPGEKQIVVQGKDIEFTTNECVIFPNGAKDNSPSVVFFCIHPQFHGRIFFQVTRNTLRDMLKALEDLP